jgi:hypothetical protein
MAADQSSELILPKPGLIDQKGLTFDLYWKHDQFSSEAAVLFLTNLLVY